jgi:hypothetical protein
MSIFVSALLLLTTEEASQITDQPNNIQQTNEQLLLYQKTAHHHFRNGSSYDCISAVGCIMPSLHPSATTFAALTSSNNCSFHY